MALKDQKKIKDRNGEETDFPYNRVEVVNQSPINHGVVNSEWVGAGGQGVIVRPLSCFGATLDEPYDKLRSLYDVESIPEPVKLTQTQVTVVTPGMLNPSPEEIFSAEAKPAPKRGLK